MCRIVGYVDLAASYDKQEILESMRDIMTLGGPDGEGSFIDDYVALGHRRLSIIELSELGHQPMKSDDGRYCITYNGEIYNHLEIKKELIELGYAFNGHSDTEVLLKSFIEWGGLCLHKFHGMFAFAIYDKKEKMLTLARDRVGVKPLYIYQDNSFFMFSSELKAFSEHPKFEKNISKVGLNKYLKYSYISAPDTIFDNCHKLMPGTILEYSIETGKKKESSYWDAKSYYFKKNESISYNDARDTLEMKLKESFKRRMVSDVPIGMFLSGGVDSSSLLGLLASETSSKIKTFTIGFGEKEFNEAHHAKEYARYIGTDHHEHYLTKADALDIIPLLPSIWDEPFADASQIPTYLVSKFTREHVTVSLSADGGDELFYGYPKYTLTTNRVDSIRKNKAIFNSLKFLPDNTLRYLGDYLNLGDKLIKSKHLINNGVSVENAFDIGQQIFTDYYQERLLMDNKSKPDAMYLSNLFDMSNMRDEEKMLLIDFCTYLPDDILTKVDRASMAVSLESRDPFLDQDIFEFVATLPFEYKYQNGNTKHILRDILYKYIPKKLVERPKMGFGIPLEDWCKTDDSLKKVLEHYFSESFIKKQNVFNFSEVNYLVTRYFNNKSVSFNKIWTLLMFQMWYEKWMM